MLLLWGVGAQVFDRFLRSRAKAAWDAREAAHGKMQRSAGHPHDDHVDPGFGIARVSALNKYVCAWWLGAWAWAWACRTARTSSRCGLVPVYVGV